MTTMSRLRVLLLIGLVAAVPVAMPQSTPQVKSHQSVLDILQQYMPGFHPSVRQLTRENPNEPNAVKLGLAFAKVYKYATADYPGAGDSTTFDANASTIVGEFVFNPSVTPPSPETAFTVINGVYRTLLVPGSTLSIATGINTGGEIVGAYTDASGTLHGFLDNAGVFSNIDFPSALGTAALDINDSGVIVGDFTDLSGNTHGFVDNGGVFTQIDFPGATSTIAAGINLSGEVVGAWTDVSSNTHAFIENAGTFTNLDFPLATFTEALGVNDGGEISGVYTNATGPFHGFLYSDGTFTSVDVSGANGTQLARIKNNGTIIGVFTDNFSTGETHGVKGH